jgi:glycolate oxidase FAD binding subunit
MSQQDSTVAQPDQLDHLRQRILDAAATGAPLRIRGGGTKDFYGQALVGDVLDTRTWRGITSYEPSELVVTARAGTSLAELESVLAEQGQCLPFEPPHFGINTINAATQSVSAATVGGMVAAGLSGPARASVGGVRDYMLGVQILNGRGEHLTFGGQVMKNVAGYDVSRLMAGAMGTLGLITDVSLKVLPFAPAEATLVFELAQAQALAQLHCWGAQPLPLNASCWVHDATDGLAGRDLLFVRLRGAIAAVESACQKMLRDVPGLRMDAQLAATDWQACRNLRLPFFTQPPQPDMALWRLSLPQTAPVLALPYPQLLEWHGGLRWLWAPADSASAAADSLHEVARKVGGSASIFIANYSTLTRTKDQINAENSQKDRLSHSVCLSWPPALSPALLAIHRRLKAEFDPANLFNRNRLFQQD